MDLYLKYKETHKDYGKYYGTDDADVYAAAKAVDADLGYDSEGRPLRKKSIDALPTAPNASPPCRSCCPLAALQWLASRTILFSAIGFCGIATG